jgi:hypothetical protein
MNNRSAQVSQAPRLTTARAVFRSASAHLRGARPTLLLTSTPGRPKGMNCSAGTPEERLSPPTGTALRPAWTLASISAIVRPSYR